MATGQLSSVVRHLHQLVEVPRAAEQSDAELLARFTARQEQAAFAALVRRHGPMVLAVCRRVLHNGHDAEDAFQATFLVLVRKAHSIEKGAALGGWLHEVALRTALRLRASEASRRLHEQRVPDMPQKDCLAAVVWRDLQSVLDEEVQRLPTENREAFLLCYLEGMTYEEAARRLHCRPGTISRRLAQARRLLRSRLSRRGLVLPAGVLAVALAQHAAPAAVPLPLVTATVKAALASAAGAAAAAAIPVRVAALVEGGLKSMATSKVKLMAALFLAAGLLWAGAAALTGPAQASKPEAPARAAAPRPAAPAAQPPAASVPAGQELKVIGRVVDAAGKPVADVALAVFAMGLRPGRAEAQASQPDLLSTGKTDAEGHFRLSTAGAPTGRYGSLRLFARREGHGLGVAQVTLGVAQKELRIELPAEEALRGRLVDLQGQPAAAVKLGLVAVRAKTGPAQYYWPQFATPPEKAGYWPSAATTDAAGRFSLRGVGAGWGVTVQVRDERFARQELEIKASEGSATPELTMALAPARILEGTVTYEDTGKPVPHARLQVVAQQDRSFTRLQTLESRADGKGRFRLAPHAGNFFTVTAYPPTEEPYLLRNREVRWPKAGAVRQEVNLPLRRGVRVRGVVTEGPSGKTLKGASVQFTARYSDNPFYSRELLPFFGGSAYQTVTGPDGKFALTVLPGPGHLLVNGPTNDYVHAEITTRKLQGEGVRPNRRHYPDGLVPLNLKPNAAAQDVAVTLRRGTTLKGRVVGPDGKASASGQLFCHTYIPYGYTLNPVHTLPLKDGRFELPGCDPEKTVKVFFYDGERQLGAAVEMAGKQSSTVRLQPCGAATARLVDEKGAPLAEVRLSLEIPVTPGVSFFDQDGVKQYAETADGVWASNLDHARHGKLKSDAQGRVTFPALIPGARYFIIAQYLDGPGMFKLSREFVAEAGKTLELKDITVKVNR